MWIKSIHLTEDEMQKTIDFNPGMNIIHSEVNSCGKTTLIRCILYGLGFSIPDLNGFRMDRCHVSMIIVQDDVEVNVCRSGKTVVVNVDSGHSYTYILPGQSGDLFGRIFGITDATLIENILGAMYIDQDKGWSLLNRGKVIGQNKFNIENFISCFYPEELEKLVRQRDALSVELKRQKQLLSLFDKQKKIDDYHADDPDLRVLESLQIKLTEIRMEKNRLKNEEKRIQKSIDDNDHFRDFIDQMKLTLSIDGKLIPLTHDLIMPYSDNMDYLNARITIVKSRIKKLEVEIKKISGRIEEYESEKELDTIVEAFSVTPVSKMNVDVKKLRASIEFIQNKKGELDKNLQTAIVDSDLVKELDEIIAENVKKLGVFDYIEDKSPYCLIKEKIKQFSGTNSKEIVLSYRLAYSSLIQKMKGVNLPIIIDSPGNEIDQENLKKMANLLETGYCDHQIIIASIYDIPTQAKIIELNEKGMLINDECPKNTLDSFQGR